MKLNATGYMNKALWRFGNIKISKKGYSYFMIRIFNQDSAVMKVLGKVADLIILNFLWLIFSIPIITIGASTTALYYMGWKIKNDEDNHIIRTFIRVFKDNFKQATFIWILMMGVVILIIIDAEFLSNINIFNGFSKLLVIGGIISVIIMDRGIYICICTPSGIF